MADVSLPSFLEVLNDLYNHSRRSHAEFLGMARDWTKEAETELGQKLSEPPRGFEGTASARLAKRFELEGGEYSELFGELYFHLLREAMRRLHQPSAEPPRREEGGPRRDEQRRPASEATPRREEPPRISWEAIEKSFVNLRVIARELDDEQVADLLELLEDDNFVFPEERTFPLRMRGLWDALRESDELKAAHRISQSIWDALKDLGLGSRDQREEDRAKRAKEKAGRKLEEAKKKAQTARTAAEAQFEALRGGPERGSSRPGTEGGNPQRLTAPAKGTEDLGGINRDTLPPGPVAAPPVVSEGTTPKKPIADLTTDEVESEPAPAVTTATTPVGMVDFSTITREQAVALLRQIATAPVATFTSSDPELAEAIASSPDVDAPTEGTDPFGVKDDEEPGAMSDSRPAPGEVEEEAPAPKKPVRMTGEKEKAYKKRLAEWERDNAE